MTVAQRIIRDTEQITWNSERERLQRESLNRQKRNQAQDLRDRNVLHELDEANRLLHESNGSLKRENDALRQQLIEQEQQAVNVLRQVADRSETWRRTMFHFQKAWSGLVPDQPVEEETVLDMTDVKSQEVREDPSWQHEREAFIQETLKPAARARKPRT